MKFFSTYNTLFNHRVSFLTTILLFNIVCCQVVFSAQWDKTIPLSTDQWTDFPTDSANNNTSIDRLLSNYREGLTLSYSSASAIAVSSGEVMVSNSDGSVRLMLANTSSASVTFSSIDTGSEASSTTYYVYAGTSNAADTTATFYISASSTSPTGVTYYKRLGSIYNNSSSNIAEVSNDNDGHKLISPSSKSVNVTYQATTDGFVSAYTTSSGDACSIILYTGTTSTPTTVLDAASTADVDYIRYMSISGFVRAGNYYKVATSGSVTGSAMTFTQVGF